jgi:hypothetical protein
MRVCKCCVEQQNGSGLHNVGIYRIFLFYSENMKSNLLYMCPTLTQDY